MSHISTVLYCPFQSICVPVLIMSYNRNFKKWEKAPRFLLFGIFFNYKN